MSESIFIAHEDIKKFLDKLSGQLEVWVPVETSENIIEFVHFRRDCNLRLDRQATMPPKNVLFPKSETLILYEYVKNTENPSEVDIKLKEIFNDKATLVFGARPCDVKGFIVFDKVFLEGKYVDVYYKRRRQNTLFATILCEDEDEACFCSFGGLGPSDMTGSDIRLTLLKEGLVAEALTEKAKPILSLWERKATEEEIQKAKLLQEEVANKKVGSFNPEGSVEGVKNQFQNMELWQEIAGSCLSCGVCTYVCPTCYCFTITDEPQGHGGERLRSWDSCMFHQYTQEASGHNPRNTKLERYRNRLGHKFSYFPIKYKGMIACCGCGRCIRSCPVSIDIRKAVELVKEVNNACKCQP